MLEIVIIIQRFSFFVFFIGVLIFSIRTQTFIVYPSMKHNHKMKWYEVLMIYGGLVLFTWMYAKRTMLGI